MAVIATFYDHVRDISRQERISMMEALGAARELGVQALEISGNNLLGREDEVGQELAYYDLGISSIPAYFDFGKNGDVKGQATPFLEAAQYLGAPRLLVIPGFVEEGASPQEREEQTQRMVEGVCRLGDLALDYGVSLAMEEYDSPRAPFARTEEVRRFLEACPALECAFDSGNFRYAGESWEEAYEALRDRIGHVHLKDRAFSPLGGEEPKLALDGTPLYPAPVGGGGLGLEKLVDRLRSDGYDGTYTVEHYGAPRALEYLSQSVKWLRDRLGL